jgi:error-prone DNA polymerase
MTANVITYRDRSAAREVGKALGFPEASWTASKLRPLRLGTASAHPDAFDGAGAEAGFDPGRSPRSALRALWQGRSTPAPPPRPALRRHGDLPGRLDAVVPLENASMPGRTVVQWDKDDCADLGIIKVDLLGLGMMAALEEASADPRERRAGRPRPPPPDDPATYADAPRADTVGVFQVESRAQMATLPR